MTVKLVDEARAGINTPLEDSELVVPLAPHTKYRVTGKVFFTAQDYEDFRFKVLGPDAPEFYFLHYTSSGAGYAGVSSYRVDNSPNGNVVNLSGTTSPGGVGRIEIDGLITTGGSGGELKFLWAQNLPGNNATVVKAGSYIEVIPVA